MPQRSLLQLHKEAFRDSQLHFVTMLNQSKKHSTCDWCHFICNKLPPEAIKINTKRIRRNTTKVLTHKQNCKCTHSTTTSHVLLSDRTMPLCCGFERNYLKTQVLVL